MAAAATPIGPRAKILCAATTPCAISDKACAISEKVGPGKKQKPGRLAHHGYQLAPVASELRRWMEVVEALVASSTRS